MSQGLQYFRGPGWYKISFINSIGYTFIFFLGPFLRSTLVTRLGLRVERLEFRAWSLGLRAWGLELRTHKNVTGSVTVKYNAIQPASLLSMVRMLDDMD